MLAADQSPIDNISRRIPSIKAFGREKMNMCYIIVVRKKLKYILSL